MNTSLRRTLNLSLAAAATAGLMTLGLGSAAAHVNVTPDETAAGAGSNLTFSFQHGCDVSPTTQVAITLPDELNDATPNAHPGWDVQKVEEDLAEPRTLPDGATITKRVSQIVYTAKTPVPDGVKDSLTISVTVPEAEGSTLAFPVLQTCEQGATDWAEIPAEGQDPHELESPAPSFAVTAASAEGHGHGPEQAEEAASGDTASGDTASGDAAAEPASADVEAASQTASTGSEAAGWVGLGAGLLGLAAGGTALARTRKAKQ
jgi:periplasmic copper chaperone A